MRGVPFIDKDTAKQRPSGPYEVNDDMSRCLQVEIRNKENFNSHR